MRPTSTNQKGFSAIEILLTIVLVILLGFSAYYVISQSQDELSNDETETLVEDEHAVNNPANYYVNNSSGTREFNCSGYKIDVPNNWHTATKQYDDIFQCNITTWSEDELPPITSGVFDDGARIVISISSVNADNVKAFVEELYADPNDWVYPTELIGIEDVVLKAGNGVKATTEGGHYGNIGTVYYFLDKNTLVTLSPTETNNEDLQKQIMELVKSLRT